MMKIVSRALVAGMLLFALAQTADAQTFKGNAYNLSGSCTRTNANTTSYGSGAITKLFGCQPAGTASGGTPIAATIAGGGLVPGYNIITQALLQTNGTGASGASYSVYLFTGQPKLTGLSDQSTYVGPYAADIVGNGYVGKLTCSGMQATNDGTAQYYTFCTGGGNISSIVQSASNTLTYVVEVTNGYTPIAAEKLSLFLSTMPGQ